MGDRLTGEGIEMLRTVAIMAASAAFLASSFQAQAEISDQRMHDAAAVFHEMMAAGDQGIPSNLLEKAQCVVIVPGLKGRVLGRRRLRKRLCTMPSSQRLDRSGGRHGSGRQLRRADWL